MTCSISPLRTIGRVVKLHGDKMASRERQEGPEETTLRGTSYQFVGTVFLDLGYCGYTSARFRRGMLGNAFRAGMRISTRVYPACSPVRIPWLVSARECFPRGKVSTQVCLACSPAGIPLLVSAGECFPRGYALLVPLGEGFPHGYTCFPHGIPCLFPQGALSARAHQYTRGGTSRVHIPVWNRGWKDFPAGTSGACPRGKSYPRGTSQVHRAGERPARADFP